MRTFACAMALLFGLIMMYGWQHLSAIEYGYRIESEKQQVQQLEEQNRQLRLTEAQLGDPARIDQMARQLGLTAPRPGQVVRPDATADPNAPALAAGRAPRCRLFVSFGPFRERSSLRSEESFNFSPGFQSAVARFGSRTGIVTPMSRMRVLNILVFFASGRSSSAGRLVWLQVFRHQEFVERAAMQQERGFEVAPRRGVLYDRNLHELAMTVLVDSVYAVP